MSNWSVTKKLRNFGAAIAFAAMVASPAGAQIISVDPDLTIDGDLASEEVIQALDDAADSSRDVTGQAQVVPAAAETVVEAAVSTGSDSAARYGEAVSDVNDAVNSGATNYEDMELDLPENWNSAEQAAQSASQNSNAVSTQTADGQTTYKKDDLIGAAQGVFGDGAEGIAGLIENILSDQGEPNAYIVGREGGGALVVGVRYGSGTLFHKIEGDMPVYWTGPSIGFDAGANVGSTFVLVYNLHDSDDLYKRFPAGEGHLYFVGGFNASYMRRGDIVLIPIRVGAGLRVGVNAGYMRFSRKHRWLPF